MTHNNEAGMTPLEAYNAADGAQDAELRARLTPWRASGDTLLVDFLLARIAEDEVVAQTRRDLAECETKRRILGAHPHLVDADDVPNYCNTCRNWPGSGYCKTYRALALPYADHPDFREEWR